jgi:hypothetical protein
MARERTWTNDTEQALLDHLHRLYYPIGVWFPSIQATHKWIDIVGASVTKLFFSAGPGI